MNKSIFSLLTGTAILTAVLFSACGPTESFGTTTTLPTGETTTTTTTTIPQTNDYAFVFRPAFNTYYGSSIQSVQVGGAFNSWDFNNGAMTYNSASNVYEFQTTVIGNELPYIYKVTFDSPVPNPYNNYQSNTVVYLADPLSSEFSPGSYSSLNSILILPYTNTLMTNFVKITNMQEAVGRIKVFRYFDPTIYEQTLNLIPSTNYLEYAVVGPLYKTLDLEIKDTNEESVADRDYFHTVSYFVCFYGNFTFPLVDMHYPNSTMSPASNTIVQTTNIVFGWELPSFMTSGGEVHLYIRTKDIGIGYETYYTNLSGNVTNFTFRGDPDISGNQEYYWSLEFNADGVEANTREIYFFMTNE